MSSLQQAAGHPVNAPPAQAPTLVVKLGGSLAMSSALSQWLRELSHHGAARFAVVPGGGPFADAVRTAQRRWRFSDRVAHSMAVGAMNQFGHMLCGIEPRALPCTTLEQIEQAWTQGRLPVWLPAELMHDSALPANWDVTSDTIAAWLAGSLRVPRLLLVKSCDVPPAWRDPAALAAAGIVDRALPDYLARTGVSLQVMHRDRCSELSQIVSRLL